MITIRVGVIDNLQAMAEDVIDYIHSFNSEYKNVVTYSIIYAEKQPNAFTEAHKKIMEGTFPLLDVLFIDYNLDGGLGTTLFRKIYFTNNAYKVLHSETDNSNTLAENDRRFFHRFSESKSEESIHEALKIYENEVLKLKLYGNPALEKLYFKNGYYLTDAAKEPVAGVLLKDVLYGLLTDGKRITFYYRDDTKRTIEEARTTGNLSVFNQVELGFVKINGSLVVNLLWVASIDFFQKKVRFIPIDDIVPEHSFEQIGSTFKEQADRIQQSLDSLPYYYKRM